MKKNLNFQGVKKLDKKEQQKINGGVFHSCPSDGGYCTVGMPVHCITAYVYICIDNKWVRV
ncbi:hypothetical protein [Tenacibaculum agarivorans]|uniref:hypothetical protein n=1 Tax=Tenacibaculum agarivorans TaxID=1908389 RepID=UPI00094BBD21|nr:hypothetical protein [Tenacibaculum agarivorans]